MNVHFEIECVFRNPRYTLLPIQVNTISQTTFRFCFKLINRNLSNAALHRCSPIHEIHFSLYSLALNFFSCTHDKRMNECVNYSCDSLHSNIFQFPFFSIFGFNSVHSFFFLSTHCALNSQYYFHSRITPQVIRLVKCITCEYSLDFGFVSLAHTHTCIKNIN